MRAQTETIWEPQPGPQSLAIAASWCDELFFGGARGGGKSDYLLGDFLEGVPMYGNRWHGILFRKTYDELEELQARAMQIYPATGAVFKSQKSEKYPFSNCWYWPNGATLKMRYLEREMDADRYQGHQYTWIGFDELTNYPNLIAYNKLKGCLRAPRDGGEQIRTRIRASGNPGGRGHIEVKARFIDIAPPLVPYTDPETGLTRMFVKSKIQDNKYLADEPQYIAMLKSSGSEELVKAWLEGDWDVVAGAYFDCWNREKLVISPFKVPDHWLKFRSFDWGSYRPFSVGWYAVSPGEMGFPRGSLIKYREWYGKKEPNIGLKMTAEEVADGIIWREISERISYGVADPSCWKVDGGPSLVERMMVYAKGNGRSLMWRKADNSRLTGWDQMRKRMVGDGGEPMIYFFNTCVDSIRTIPLLQHDENHPEDLDTDMEDHAADECRYACMSRPWTPLESVQEEPVFEMESGKTQLTFNELRDLNSRNN